MFATDLKSLADIVRDNRTPCQRDGHNFQLAGSATGDLLFCTKCGEAKKLPSPPAIGFTCEAN